MSHEELIRACFAVPVAVLLPFGVAVSDRRVRALVVGVLVTAALSPYLSDWHAWLIALGAAGAVVLPDSYDPARPIFPLLCAASATVLAICASDPSAAWEGVKSVGADRNVVIVAAGGLAAVFLAGALIGRVLATFAQAIKNHAVGMENAGRLIGWLERALLYGLFVAGAPDAAALVLAGKSVARFPSFDSEEFAEYYLIGSFLSLTIAAAIGVGVRASIGLHPLVPIHV